MKKVQLILLLLFVVVIMCGCIPTDVPEDGDDRAGFFSGIWHGWIAPFSLIWSFFNSKYTIYAAYNKGFTYDLGFYMAVISGFGALSLTRKKDD